MVGKLAMPTMKCLSPFLTIKPPPILLFKKFYKILILNNKTNKNYKPIYWSVEELNVDLLEIP